MFCDQEIRLEIWAGLEAGGEMPVLNRTVAGGDSLRVPTKASDIRYLHRTERGGRCDLRDFCVSPWNVMEQRESWRQLPISLTA